MKILWITSHLLPEHAKLIEVKTGVGGGWITGLANIIRDLSHIQLTIATTTVRVKELSKFKENNITFYAVPVKNIVDLTDDIIENYQKIEKEISPDIIHIHGSEYFHGLLCAREYLKTPTVLSIQGIIGGCSDWVNGNLLQSDLPFSLKEFLLNRSLKKTKQQWVKRSIQETEIFRVIQHFIGRTEWDHHYVRMLNSNANYYYGGEILRDEFYTDACWNINNIKRYSIFCSSMSYPLKGFHVLLEAVALLKNEYKDISITVTGHQLEADSLYQKIKQGSYSKYLVQLIQRYNLQDYIHYVGNLDASEMKRAFLAHHLFVLPSFIDNSPNSVCEAQILGVPSIASSTGGVADIIIDNETGLLSQVGDAVVLAHKIKNIFDDDNLATQLSIKGRDSAIKRHDRSSIAQQLIDVYKQAKK